MFSKFLLFNVGCLIFLLASATLDLVQEGKFALRTGPPAEAGEDFDQRSDGQNWVYGRNPGEKVLIDLP